MREQRGWRRRFTDYLSVVLIGPVLAFTALGITASMTSGRLVQWLIAQEPFGTLYYLLGQLVPYVFIMAAFAFVYLFLPNTRVPYRAALIGACCAGLAWKLVGWAFSAVVVESASYSAIYSGFATVILFMIWLYANWLILLLGGVIAFHCQHPWYRRHKTGGSSLGSGEYERLGFLLMQVIAGAYYGGERPLPLGALAQRAGVPEEVAAQALRPLLRDGLLAELGSEPTAYLPAVAPETVSLTAIRRAMRTSDDSRLPVGKGEDAEIVDELDARLERAAAGVLGSLSLKDLAAGIRRVSDAPGASDN